MFYVYVLRSLRDGKRYTGYTSKLPEERLKEHNKGNNVWTGQNKPFELIYAEPFDSKKEAIRREHFLKSGKGREYLNKIIPR